MSVPSCLSGKKMNYKGLKLNLEIAVAVKKKTSQIIATYCPLSWNIIENEFLFFFFAEG